MIMQSTFLTDQETNWAASLDTGYQITFSSYLPNWAKRFSIIRTRIFNSAVRCAYVNFTIQYPEWTNSLFDEHFLSHRAKELLAPIMKHGSYPQPVELALAWDEQVGPASDAIRQRRIAEITPAIADFLKMLEAEFSSQM